MSVLKCIFPAAEIPASEEDIVNWLLKDLTFKGHDFSADLNTVIKVEGGLDLKFDTSESAHDLMKSSGGTHTMKTSDNRTIGVKFELPRLGFRRVTAKLPLDKNEENLRDTLRQFGEVWNIKPQYWKKAKINAESAEIFTNIRNGYYDVEMKLTLEIFKRIPHDINISYIDQKDELNVNNNIPEPMNNDDFGEIEDRFRRVNSDCDISRISNGIYRVHCDL